MKTEVTWKKLAAASILAVFALPLTAQAVVIDTGIPIGNDRHWSVDVLTGGSTESVVFTTRRYPHIDPSSELITESVVSSYRAFVDPGNDGQGFALQGSEPVRRSDNSVISTGAFIGANGNTIRWEAVSSVTDEFFPRLRTDYTFTVDASTPGPIGPLRVYQYLDADIGDPNDDVFGTVMNAVQPWIGTFDGVERFGVVQHTNSSSSINTSSIFRLAGLAADSFDQIQERIIMGSGQPVAQTNSGLTHAEINLPLLDDFSQFSDFTHYGPGNIVSVLAWDVKPDFDHRWTNGAEISTWLVGHSALSPPSRPVAAPAGDLFSCRISGCVVPVTCRLPAPCDVKIELLAGPFGLTKFAVASANIPPGATDHVRLKLTKRGRSILRAKRNKKINGVMEIRNASTGALFSSTRVRIRLK